MIIPALAYLLMQGCPVLARNNQIHMLMKITQTKDPYISPECEVLDVTLEGVIAASVPDIPYGEELFS